MLPPPSILGFSRGVAQTEARRVWDAEAGGSSPPTPTICHSPQRMENFVRGLSVSKAAKKLDIVLVDVRYDDDHKVLLARGFSRRGFVWGDRKLFGREAILTGLEAGDKIVTGELSYLPGDFDVFGTVRAEKMDGSSRLLAEGEEGIGDLLGLPLF